MLIYFRSYSLWYLSLLRFKEFRAENLGQKLPPPHDRPDLRFIGWLLYTQLNVGQRDLADFPLTTRSGSVRTEHVL